MLDLLKKRRTIRKFKDKKVEKDKIDKIVQGALTSPTGRNLRHWEIVVIQDEETIKKLSTTRSIFKGVLSTAPLAMVIIGDDDKSTTWLSDTSIMSMVIQLMAEDLGLGSCWLHTENRFDEKGKSVEEKVKEIIELDEPNKRILNIIAIGYKDEEKESHNLEELPYNQVHYEKYRSDDSEENFMLELLMNRRSIRKYQDKPVEKEKIDTIIKAALTSPTGHNRRAWELIVVEDKEILEKLSTSRGVHSKFMKDAPLGFVILLDMERAVTWSQDGSFMAAIIQLMGQSLGLGSCWIHASDVTADDGSSMEENIKDILDIPKGDRYKVLCMISMGYPAEIKNGHNEKAFRYNKVHYDKF